jgi:Anti-sigma-K factor rskA
MSDETDNGTGNGTDDLAEIEAMLRELDERDLQPTPPPPALWSGIEQAIIEPAPVVAIADRHRTRTWLLAAAAVFVLAVAGALVAVVAGGSDDTEVVSTAVLLHDPTAFDPRGAESAATAQLVERDGHLELEFSDAELPTLADDDLELWLIEPDADGNPVDVQPVAVIKGSEPGSYRVPDGLDPASHYVVDISIEPRDGNAAHSGQSILRGPLEPT